MSIETDLVFGNSQFTDEYQDEVRAYIQNYLRLTIPTDEPPEKAVVQITMENLEACIYNCLEYLAAMQEVEDLATHSGDDIPTQ